jgi:hypothetical protein
MALGHCRLALNEVRALRRAKTAQERGWAVNGVEQIVRAIETVLQAASPTKDAGG